MGRPGRKQVLDTIAKGQAMLRGEDAMHLEMHTAADVYALVAMVLALQPPTIVLTDNDNTQVSVRMNYEQ